MTSPERFFAAIDNQDKASVRELIINGVELNAQSPRGTALYRSVKLHNSDMVKLLVKNGADCNIVQRDFEPSRPYERDGLHYSCAILTPIDLLCTENNPKDDEILKYLLENRPMVSNMIERQITHCQKLFNDENNGLMFDYFVSSLLRKNIYEYYSHIGPQALTILCEAFLNENPTVNEGGTHEIFFTITIRSFFEQLVRFRLGKSSTIESENQYSYILHELTHSTEAYNLLSYITHIPDSRAETFYPSIAKNIINKLKNMKEKEEYTLPMKWEGHAVCLNFVREPNSIIIRIDNLNTGEIEEHEIYVKQSGSLAMIPKIIGEIPLDQLQQYEGYFISLLSFMKELSPQHGDGIQLLYHNEKLQNLNLDRIRIEEMTQQLKSLSDELNCFTKQAKNNCFVKSFEPGFAIRANNKTNFQRVISIPQDYARYLYNELPNIISNRDELENRTFLFWEQEPTIRFNAEYARKLHQHVVVWMDKHIGVPGNNETIKQHFRRITYPLYICTEPDDKFFEFLCSQEETKTTIFFIVSGTLAKTIMPDIWKFSCIIQIYIYCAEISAHLDWAFDYIEKMLMFNFDKELLIRVTNDIARYLEDVAEKEEAQGNTEKSAGLLDWADWLYNDATTIREAFCRTRRRQIRQQRENLNNNRHIQYPNQFTDPL